MDPIPAEYSRGEARFLSGEVDTDVTLLDFWAWAFSDVLTNTTRGILAEFIVATALGIDTQRPREVWANRDLEYRGLGIEVKSSSYHQSWYQKKISAISFNVRKTRGWNAARNAFDEESRRQADAYVLCLLAEKDRSQVNPLNLDQWRFWVVDTRFFDERERSQDSITYGSLVKEVGEPVHYLGIKRAVDELVGNLV